MLDTSTLLVIHEIKTFFGCIKYASNLPVLIVSVKLNASLKKNREKPKVIAANPHNNNTCFKV